MNLNQARDFRRVIRPQIWVGGGPGDVTGGIRSLLPALLGSCGNCSTFQGGLWSYSTLYGNFRGYSSSQETDGSLKEIQDLYTSFVI